MGGGNVDTGDFRYNEWGDDWENKFNRYGGVLEYKTLLAGTTVKAGYWYESFNLTTIDHYFTLQNGGLRL